MVFVLFPPLLLNPEYGFLSAHPSLAEKLLVMGVLYAAFPLAQLLGAPLIGEYADRYGRKNLFFVTIVGSTVAYFLTGFMLMLESVTLVFVARFLTGLFSGNQGLCNASIADLSPNPKQRARNYGLLTVVWGLSFPIALLLGGFLSDPSLSPLFTPSFPFFVAGAITLLSLITLIVFFPEPYEQASHASSVKFSQGIRNIFDALSLPQTRQFFLLLLIWTLGWGYSVTWYGAYVMKQFGVSQEVATVGLMIQGVGWTLGGALLKPLLLRVMELWAIAKLSYLLTGVLLLAAGCMPSLATFIVCYAVAAFLGAVSLSSTFNLISISSPSKVQGKAMGIAQSMVSLGFFLVPIFGGVTGAISIATFFPISGCFLLVGWLLLSRCKRPL